MDQRKIGAFLKALRKEQGLTQEQLAELLHVSGRTVSRWETGSNMPDIGMLVELAEQFEIHTVFLRFSSLVLTKNLSTNQLAELCAVAFGFYSIRRWKKCKTYPQNQQNEAQYFIKNNSPQMMYGLVYCIL